MPNPSMPINQNCQKHTNMYDVWISTGISDLKHLDDKLKKHAECKYHLQNEMNLVVLGQVDIRQQLDDAYRLKIKKWIKICIF